MKDKAEDETPEVPIRVGSAAHYTDPWGPFKDQRPLQDVLYVGYGYGKHHRDYDYKHEGHGYAHEDFVLAHFLDEVYPNHEDHGDFIGTQMDLQQQNGEVVSTLHKFYKHKNIAGYDIATYEARIADVQHYVTP